MSEEPARVAVETRELAKRFGGFTAVDRVSLDVRAGEVFGFLGPNGAGKTTTIRMLCGIITPSSGSARILQFQVPRDNARIRQCIGYMSQRFSLYDDLSGAENLLFFGSVYGLERAALQKKSAQVLAQFDLESQRDTLTRELPTGARQRLALACALLHEPGVLFLDEPTSGMDPASRRAFWGLVRGLADGGRAVLVTTHYMDEAEYCDRLCLINQGRVVAEGTREQVKGLSTRAALTVACAPVGRGLGALLAHAELGEAAIYGDRLRLVTDDPERARRTLPVLLPGAGVVLTGVEDAEPTLEDVFIQLAGRNPEKGE